MESSQVSLIEDWIITCNTRCLQRTIGKENADVFIRKDGTTPLHLAAALPKEADSIAIATVLLSNGANPNIPNNEGKTSMHVAAFMGYTDLLQLFLLNGGDPLLGDRRGYSPVDWASHGRHQNTLKFLNHLLDTEEFSYDKNDPKFSLSFMRATVVEVGRFNPTWITDSTSSFYSCHSNIKDCEGAETSLGTHIANFNKPNSDNPKLDKTCISSKPPDWFTNYHFLKSLKQEVEVCQGDTDSENDLKALQCCLGRKLQEEEFCSCESAESETECTLMELNIAHLTIDISSDTSRDAVENNAGVNGYPSFEEQSLSCERSSHGISTYDTGKSTLCTENSSFEKEFCCNEKKRRELCLGQADGYESAENHYKPELCNSLHHIKYPKKREMFRSMAYEASPSLKKEFFERELIKQTGPCHTTPSSSSFNSTGSKSAQSSASTCSTLLSIAKEFLYKDTEAGIQLVEKRCPTLAVLSSCDGSSHGVSNRCGSSPVEVLEELALEKSFDSVGPITDTIKAMSIDRLRDNLKKLGFEPGPITPSTHTVYMRHLLRLRRKPCQSQKNQCLPPEYCKELSLVLRQPHSIPWEAWTALEEEMSLPFSRPDPTRHWRDGTSKSCFNYLLLDPRITQNLPLIGSAMDEKEKINCFVSSIFYVGKGSRNRPYYHLYDAMKKRKSNTQNEKIEKIQEIWTDDSGVVSLHVFQNTIPVEAWTREAAMISALGLKNLCNSVQGTFYGPSSTWTNSKRRQLGTYLLYRSFNIFLQEGERQLRPCDIALPFTAA